MTRKVVGETSDAVAEGLVRHPIVNSSVGTSYQSYSTPLNHQYEIPLVFPLQGFSAQWSFTGFRVQWLGQAFSPRHTSDRIK